MISEAETSARTGFWESLDRLVSSSHVIIDRPKGSTHPRYAEMIYPLDYGYLKDTRSNDGGGIDLWRGSGDPHYLSGILCTVDLEKRDAEIKLVLGCSAEEILIILDFLNGKSMYAVYLRRT
jgi:inorganic pyrophosphatase